MGTKQERQPLQRRRHSSELKGQVLVECAEPGASVARVTMAHGLNANLVHKWKRQAVEQAPTQEAPALPPFIPVPIASSQVVSETPEVIDLDLQRAGLKVRVLLPMSAASMSAAWLREILR